MKKCMRRFARILKKETINKIKSPRNIRGLIFTKIKKHNMKLIVRDLCHKLDISHYKQVTVMLLLLVKTLIGPCVPLRELL